MPIPSSIRINKYISDSGMCSRRDADRYVENGRVLINDMQAEFGAQVFDGDVVKVDGQLIGQRDETGLVMLVLNKPVGIITSMDESLPDNIGTLIHHSKRIFPVGRLDKDSQGLILLTNHGKVVKESEYIFRITLVQGLNRQIRRMSKYFGFEVTRLERVRIMNIHLEGLPLGESRELTGDEEKELLRRIQHSVSDETLP